jgi:FHS family L-fucose permease-like MFS transporter
LQASFWLTIACEAYILFYAVWGSKPTNALPPEMPPLAPSQTD